MDSRLCLVQKLYSHARCIFWRSPNTFFLVVAFFGFSRSARSLCTSRSSRFLQLRETCALFYLRLLGVVEPSSLKIKMLFRTLRRDPVSFLSQQTTEELVLMRSLHWRAVFPNLFGVLSS